MMDDPTARPLDPPETARPTSVAEVAEATVSGQPVHPSTSLGPGAPPDPGVPSREAMTIALTPSQMAVGGAVVAGLLVVGARLILGRRRRSG